MDIGNQKQTDHLEEWEFSWWAGRPVGQWAGDESSNTDINEGKENVSFCLTLLWFDRLAPYRCESGSD